MTFHKWRWNSQANENYLQFEKYFIAISNQYFWNETYCARLLWIHIFHFNLKMTHCAVYAAKESKANIRLLCDKKSHLNGNLAHFSWSESEPNLSPTKSAHLMQSTYLYSLLNITSYPQNWSLGTGEYEFSSNHPLKWVLEFLRCVELSFHKKCILLKKCGLIKEVS